MQIPVLTPLYNRFCAFAGQRTQTEWSEFLREKQIDMRIWMQEHGEKALLLGVLVGILIVVFYKLVVLVIVLAILLGFAIAALSRPETSSESGKLDRD
jgi:hypothetical protein